MNYYKRIKQKADEGKVADYYTFWVIITLIVGTVLITPIYLYYPSDSLIGKLIFVLLFITISLTNFQALFVAIDFAKHSEPYNDVWHKGAIFMGTMMRKLEEEEAKQAKKEGRKARTTEQVSEEFANMIILGMKNVSPLIEEARTKGVTTKKIMSIAHDVIEHQEDIVGWIKRLEKLMPIFEGLAGTVENVDQKILGRVVGRRVAEFIQEEIKKGEEKNAEENK